VPIKQANAQRPSPNNAFWLPIQYVTKVLLPEPSVAVAAMHKFAWFDRLRGTAVPTKYLQGGVDRESSRHENCALVAFRVEGTPLVLLSNPPHDAPIEK
jgi:hypothetical protein